jgi:hypothetical protein
LLNTVLGSLSSGVAASTSSYESIASQAISGTNTLTFSSIPSTYKHLQIRYLSIFTVANVQIRMGFNGDYGSSSNYTRHYLYGDGSATGASGSANFPFTYAKQDINAASTTYPWVGIIDIIDYASTTKYKTTRVLCGGDANSAGTGDIQLNSGLWQDTTAINSITLQLSSGNYSSGSTFALYGIKG